MAKRMPDRVASLELCATTVAGGRWTKECVQALAGHDVIILQDNDEPGRKKALAAAQALYGSAKTIRIVGLPDLPDKGDVSDWLDADPRRAEKLAEICFEVAEWVPSPATSGDVPDHSGDRSEDDRNIRADGINDKARIRWANGMPAMIPSRHRRAPGCSAMSSRAVSLAHCSPKAAQVRRQCAMPNTCRSSPESP